MEASSARDAELPPATLGWLRQLAIGFSLHRLYSGEQVEVAIDASERMAETAARALASGPVEVTLRAGEFVGAPVEGTLARLAGACFERRIEHLALLAVPSAHELQVLFDVLSDEPDDLEVGGGAPARLHAGGMRSLVASLDVPDATLGEEAEEPAVGTEVELDPGAPEPELRWTAYPGDDAEGFYAHLSELASAHDATTLARSSFHHRAMGQAATLPPEERARFEHLLLARMPHDGLAAGLLGHLTDIGLADLVGRVSRAQRLDPRELAMVVAHHLDRSDDLPRLTLDLLLASNLGAGEPDARHGPVPTTPSAHPLARAFPDDEAAGRGLATIALVDVLANGPRPEQVGPLVSAIVAQVRADVVAGDVAAVTGLLEAWRRGLGLLPAATAARPALPSDVLDEPTVMAALQHGSGTASKLLEPLADAAVPHLLAALEPEQPDLVQRAAAAVLAPLAVSHPDAVSAAVGPRSVASRLALLDVLQRVDDPRVVPVLSRLSQHRDPVLLHRVIEVLARVDPAVAAPILGAIVSRSDERRVQRRGLEALAERPVPAARALLERFADRTTSPLPRGSRRLARSLTEGRR